MTSLLSLLRVEGDQDISLVTIVLILAIIALAVFIFTRFRR